MGGLYVGILTWLTWVLFVNDCGDEKNSSKIVESLPCCSFVEGW